MNSSASGSGTGQCEGKRGLRGKLSTFRNAFRVSPTPDATLDTGLESRQLTPSTSTGVVSCRGSSQTGFEETLSVGSSSSSLRDPFRKKFSFRRALKKAVGKGKGDGKSRENADAGENSPAMGTPPPPASSPGEAGGSPREPTSNSAPQTEEQQVVTNGTSRQSPGDGGGGSHVPVTATVAQLPGKNGGANYLEYFLTYLYYIGMSPIKPASAQKLPKWIHWIQLTIFWIFSIVAALQALDESKYGWIQFRLSEDMFNFISFGFYFANCVTRVYYIWLLTRSAGPISQFLQKIHHFGSVYGHNASRFWPVAISFGIGSLSVVLSVICTVLGPSPLDRWSLKDALLGRSTEFSETIFVWSPTDWENKTDQLDTIYGTRLTVTTEIFAACASFLYFCGTLHACVLVDLWLMVILQIFVLASQFSKSLSTTAEHDASGRCPLTTHWQEFLQLRSICDDTDKQFGRLVAFVHLQNLLQFCYFLLQSLKKSGLTIYPIVDLFSVVKISLAYLLAKRTAEENDSYEECVIHCSDCSATIYINVAEKSVPVLLTNMKNHPVGVGRGEFYINQAFVIRFVCAVGSLFVLLAGESKERCG